jgi:hypothetical protein
VIDIVPWLMAARTTGPTYWPKAIRYGTLTWDGCAWPRRGEFTRQRLGHRKVVGATRYGVIAACISV